MRQSKIISLLFWMVILILAIWSPSLAEEKKDFSDRIRVSYGMYIDDLPLYVALEENLWKKEGLDVELVRINAEPDVIAAAVRGDIQAGSIGLPSVFHAAAKGLPIKVYAWFGKSHKGTTCGIHVDRDGDVRAVKDLKGKRITTSGSIVPDMFLKEALAQNSMTFDDLKTMKGIRIDVAMQQEAALRSAGVDGTVT